MERFGDFIEKVETILKRKSIFKYELYIQESSQFDVESKDGKIDFLNASQFMGMALRILKDNKMGFSYITISQPDLITERLFEKEIERVIEDAILGSEAILPDSCWEFLPPLRETPPSLPIFDHTLVNIPEEKKIEKAKFLEEAARAFDPKRIEKVRKASYQDSLSHRVLVNSNGLRFSFDSTLSSVSVMAVAREGVESEMGWEFDFSHFFNDIDVEKVGKRASQMAIEKLGGRRIKSGRYPVILRNDVATEFLSQLSHSFLAEQVLKEKSSLAGKIGQRFFSQLISIFDDGLDHRGISCAPIDGEGNLTQRTPLVLKGEVVGYLYDSYWANRENLNSKEKKARSTGNSRRPTLKAPPLLGVTNFIIENGDSTFEDLLKNMVKGLLVDEVMGIHTVDPISGDFSLGCSGIWIENGEKAYPVKSIAIAGNLFDLFKRVKAVGNDFRFFGSFGSPSLLIDYLEISGN